MSKEITRRSFLKAGTAAAVGLTVAPSSILGKTYGHTAAPSDKLNVLGVGIGGRGASDLRAVAKTENIIGLADVDWAYADHVFKDYPKAKKFNDYRKMYDKMLKSADAVIVATADHTHAIIAADAITASISYIISPTLLASSCLFIPVSFIYVKHPATGPALRIILRRAPAGSSHGSRLNIV